MKIISLTENTTKKDNIAAEHGLSLYIEANGQKILFDMGQTDSFYKNALTLGIDLSEIDIAILSHGHYDHGGGLKQFLEINKKAPVYINAKAFEPHFNGTEKYIGLDITLKDSSRLVYVGNDKIIDTYLGIFSCNNRCDFNAGSTAIFKFKMSLRCCDNVHISVKTAVECKVCHLRINSVIR